jgi:hypothetical protein
VDAEKRKQHNPSVGHAVFFASRCCLTVKRSVLQGRGLRFTQITGLVTVGQELKRPLVSFVVKAVCLPTIIIKKYILKWKTQ